MYSLDEKKYEAHLTRIYDYLADHVYSPFIEVIWVDDVAYMKRATALAKLATGHTSPNPLRVPVVVKDNTIIGEGYHHILVQLMLRFIPNQAKWG